MVRQRKCHTRMRRSLSASGDAVPEGQPAEAKLEEGKCPNWPHCHSKHQHLMIVEFCWISVESWNVLSILV